MIFELAGILIIAAIYLALILTVPRHSDHHGYAPSDDKR